LPASTVSSGQSYSGKLEWLQAAQKTLTPISTTPVNLQTVNITTLLLQCEITGYAPRNPFPIQYVPTIPPTQFSHKLTALIHYLFLYNTVIVCLTQSKEPVDII